MNTCTFEYFYNNINKVSDNRVHAAARAFEYLSRPDTVFRMINTIELGIQPLSAVCKQLEQLIDCSDMTLRQIIGREMRFILKHYGYSITGTNERLRDFCKGKYFKTGSKYAKDVNYTNKYRFNVTITNIQ